MSTQQHVSSIAEYKGYAIVKYCNESETQKHELDELSISNNLYNLSTCYCFISLS